MARRIGHEARAAATSTLDTALRDGRVDLAEYDRRLAVVQAARFGDDLTPAIADLPVRDGQRGPGLRISTADREAALVRLTEALTDGRLEATEYPSAEERLQRAVTYADLDAIVGNLAAGPGTVSRRVSDADREAVAAQLQDAVEGGFLDVTEFDERVRAVYAARLSSELTRLVADLPEPEPPPAAPVEKEFRRAWGPDAFNIIFFYSFFGLTGVPIIAGALSAVIGTLALLIPVAWLIGLFLVVRSQRRLVAVEAEQDDRHD